MRKQKKAETAQPVTSIDEKSVELSKTFAVANELVCKRGDKKLDGPLLKDVCRGWVYVKYHQMFDDNTDRDYRDLPESDCIDRAEAAAKELVVNVFFRRVMGDTKLNTYVSEILASEDPIKDFSCRERDYVRRLLNVGAEFSSRPNGRN